MSSYNNWTEEEEQGLLDKYLRGKEVDERDWKCSDYFHIELGGTKTCCICGVKLKYKKGLRYMVPESEE